MKRLNAKKPLTPPDSDSLPSTQLEEAAILMKKLYRAGKLKVQTPAGRREFLDRTIRNAERREKEMTDAAKASKQHLDSMKASKSQRTLSL